MENLGIDTKLLIAQTVNFALFFFIFKKFIAKPFARYINQEKTRELEKERALKEALEEKERLQLKAIKLQQAAKQEATKIIGEAKDAAIVVREKIIEEANQEAEMMRNKTKKQLEEDQNKIYKEFQDKVLEMSLILINKTFKDILTDDFKKKITEKILRSSSDRTLVS